MTAPSIEYGLLSPVLIVFGDKDTDTPPATAMAIAAAYKATKGVKVSGVELSGDHSFSWSRRELSDTVIDSMNCLSILNLFGLSLSRLRIEAWPVPKSSKRSTICCCTGRRCRPKVTGWNSAPAPAA